MHIRFETTIRGGTLTEITTAATEAWREFINDPAADLPWNSELIIAEDPVSSTYLQPGYLAAIRVTTDTQSAHATPPPTIA